MEEPGGLQSTGSQGVGHDRETNTFTHFRFCEAGRWGMGSYCLTGMRLPLAVTGTFWN